MRSRYYQALWTFGLDPSELITKVEHSEKVRLSLEFAASPVDGKNWQKHIDTWLDFQIMAKATEDEVNAKASPLTWQLVIFMRVSGPSAFDTQTGVVTGTLAFTTCSPCMQPSQHPGTIRALMALFLNRRILGMNRRMRNRRMRR